ncbi:MAG: CheB methylesterase domain-containing protein [Phycisphaerae bacterium]
MGCPNLILIGSSTGGPKILRRLFAGMPTLDAAVVLVQHMPAFVNGSLCRTIASQTSMDVSLASDGLRLEAGRVYVAPSDIHLSLRNNRAITLRSGEKVNFVRPAVDVAMQSVEKDDSRKFAVILTGMGKDGAEGLRHMKQIGATTLAQNRETSVIYGMPKAAAETGCVDHVDDPEGIRDTLIRFVGRGAAVTA